MLLSGALDVWTQRAVAHLWGNSSTATCSYINTPRNLFHRITEQPQLEKPPRTIRSISWFHTRPSKNQTRCLQHCLKAWGRDHSPKEPVPHPLPSGEEPFPNIQTILCLIFPTTQHYSHQQKITKMTCISAGAVGMYNCRNNAHNKNFSFQNTTGDQEKNQTSSTWQKCLQFG